MEPHPPPSTSLTRKVSKCANTEASCLIILQDDQNLHIINQWNLSFIVLSPSLVVFPFKNRIHRSKPQPKYPVRYSTPQVALPRSSEGLEISGVTRTWNLITHSLELTKIIMQCNSCRMLLLSPICSCTILRVLGQSIQRTLERHRSTCKKRDAAVIAWSQKGGSGWRPRGQAVVWRSCLQDLKLPWFGALPNSHIRVAVRMVTFTASTATPNFMNENQPPNQFFPYASCSKYFPRHLPKSSRLSSQIPVFYLQPTGRCL